MEKLLTYNKKEISYKDIMETMKRNKNSDIDLLYVKDYPSFIETELSYLRKINNKSLENDSIFVYLCNIIKKNDIKVIVNGKIMNFSKNEF